MFDILSQLLDPTGFVPRKDCGDWTPALIGLHNVSDFLIWLSYLAIPLILVYFFRRRRDLPFSGVFLLFGLFIVSCGFTHLMEVIVFYDPLYRLAGIIKFITALASCGTVIALVPIVPRVLTLRSPRELEIEIEQRRRAEEELAYKNRQLVEAEALKNTFFANVSHEFRTPLTLILAPIESLLAGEFGPLAPPQRTGLQIIHNNAVRLLQMVTGLLDVSRLDASRLEVHREPVQIEPLMHALFDDFRPLLRQRDLNGDLALTLATATVLLDRYLFERIFFNLVSNAIKFTPAGGRVSVRVQGQGDRLRLSVEDTGIGIAQADLPHLFRKFHQLESSSTRRFEGTGLGLSLVKEFADLLGGTVAITSTPGQGSLFVVDLSAPPALHVDSPAATRPVLPSLVQKHTPPPSTRPLSGTDGATESAAGQPVPLPRVLIAEDNAELAAYVATLLHDSYQVSITADGEEALERIREAAPDLVVADVMMPRRDGLSLCRVIKSNPATASIPVVLLTALTHREALLRGWETGADEYLFKPFHPRELLTRVRSLLGAARERRKGEQLLRQANANLEVRVQERTVELAQANTALRTEVAQRRRLEEELRRRVEELADADRRKDEFLAMLAHELRNPLAPIRNALHVLKFSDANVPQLARVRAMMERQVDHLVRLVDDLLDVSRITRGIIELRRAPLALSEVLARAIETTQPLLDARRQRLSVNLPPASLRVHGDAVRLAQVVGNLLNNAAKYTDAGGQVWLSADAENGQAVVRVRDSGVGIPPDMLDRVFDLFLQLDRTLDRSQGGLGIGLTLVRSLVELHGGTVEASSPGSGKGSEFLVRLPLLHEAPAEVPHAAPKTAPSRRILVVDDNADAAEALAMVLRASGHVVRTAQDGPSGLELALSWLPEVIFLDIGLPGIDGYAVARRLREDPRLQGIQLVAVSGYGQPEDRQRSTEAGFDAHLVKPVEPAVLQAILARTHQGT